MLTMRREERVRVIYQPINGVYPQRRQSRSHMVIILVTERKERRNGAKEDHEMREEEKEGNVPSLLVPCAGCRRLFRLTASRVGSSLANVRRGTSHAAGARSSGGVRVCVSELQ